MLAIPLSHIFNTTLRTGILPQAWREANVTPIFKKGKKSLPSNYRPISLTSVICKLLETFVRDWLVGHLRENGLLSKQQYGFISGRSTTLQLLHVTEEWNSILDRGGEIDAVYLDFMKAFDTVPHRRLLTKLAAMGIEGNLLKWIEAFLSNRRQRVLIKGVPSSWRPVVSGVPQGSVLGPVLFVAYINDLPDNIQSSLYMFADDTKLYKEITEAQDRLLLQRDLDRMDQWSALWLLKFQPPKCKCMTLTNRGAAEAQRTYTLRGHALESYTVEKDLGILVDNQLNFDQHITTQASKANKVMGVIRRSFTHLDQHNFKLLYKALVRPHLEYGHAVWYPHLRKHIDLLEQVQRRATRQVPGLAHLSYTDRLRRLGLPIFL